MATNAKTDELDLTVDRCHALESEVMQLRAELNNARAELDKARAELADERTHSASLKRLVERAKARIRELEGTDHETPDTPETDDTGEPAGRRTASGQDSDEDSGEGVDLTFGTSGQKGRKSRRLSLKADKKRRTNKKVAENVYVFDDHDETRVAFDEFFAHSDPHLEKVRGFLLD